MPIKVGGRGGGGGRGRRGSRRAFIARIQFTIVKEPEETLTVGYSILNFSFNLDLNHLRDIIILFINIRMQDLVIDLSELHVMKLNVIPVSYLEGLRKRRISLIRLLLFLLRRSLFNGRECCDLINDGSWDDRGRCLLAMIVLILDQIEYLLQIIF